MPYYLAESTSSKKSPKVGVLLTNLGTPDAPTVGALRAYLAEFLSDRRVIETPRLLWLPILHGVVLRMRPAKSAEKYRQIWSKDGSPLMVYSIKQRDLVRGYLGEALKKEGLKPDSVAVEIGMRYGNPSIAKGLDTLRVAGATSIIVLPLYPQYSASTTGSTFDAVVQHMTRIRNVPEITILNGFHNHFSYLDALRKRLLHFWKGEGRPDHLLFSFHGAPEQTRRDGDPYHDQCQETARLLMEMLPFKDVAWSVAFQSRFGKARWIQPYTTEVLTKLAQKGVKRVDVICPSFVSDCLETLEEIGIGERKIFLKAGGKEFNLVPCLNDTHPWIVALIEILLPYIKNTDIARAKEKVSFSA
ncbi:MAG: ferrochelatase [Burkholderiales bacterium]|jgi:ferrochelatase|nr:ferrochelatase [Burkholderiales bacterium]